MTRFSISTLENDWERKRAARLSPVNPAIVGKIAACSLILLHKTGPVSGTEIEEIFLENLSTAPEALRQVLHLDVSVTGLSIRENTEMILGVQRAGIAGRLNPEYGDLHIKWSIETAERLLEYYKEDFPEIVEWIQEQVNKRYLQVGNF